MVTSRKALEGLKHIQPNGNALGKKIRAIRVIRGNIERNERYKKVTSRNALEGLKQIQPNGNALGKRIRVIRVIRGNIERNEKY